MYNTKKEGRQVKEGKRSKGRFVFTFEKKKVTWRRARVVVPRALSPLSPRCRASPPWRDTPVAMYGVYLVVPRFAKALVHRDFTLCLCLFAGARVKAGAPSLMRKKITGKNVCEKTSISDPFTHQRLCVPPQRGAWHVAGRDGRHDARGVERPRERHGGGGDCDATSGRGGRGLGRRRHKRLPGVRSPRRLRLGVSTKPRCVLRACPDVTAEAKNALAAGRKHAKQGVHVTDRRHVTTIRWRR